MVLLVAACSSNSNQKTTAPNSVQLHITNNTNATIYGMEISWHQDGTLLGTQGGINADGSSIKKGESMVFELLPEEVDSTEDMLVGSPLNHITKFKYDSPTRFKNSHQAVRKRKL